MVHNLDFGKWRSSAGLTDKMHGFFRVLVSRMDYDDILFFD